MHVGQAIKSPNKLRHKYLTMYLVKEAVNCITRLKTNERCRAQLKSPLVLEGLDNADPVKGVTWTKEWGKL